MMTDTLAHVIVSYAEFLEHRERRLKMAAAPKRPVDRGTIDVTAVSVVPVVPATPLVREDKNRYESPCRVKNPDRAT
jgi:hypothetical protein